MWVAFGSLIPDQGNATGVLGAGYDLATGLGKATILAVLAFVAYLIGSLVEIEPRPLIPSTSEHITRVNTPDESFTARVLVDETHATRLLAATVAAITRSLGPPLQAYRVALDVIAQNAKSNEDTFAANRQSWRGDVIKRQLFRSENFASSSLGSSATGLREALERIKVDNRPGYDPILDGLIRNADLVIAQAILDESTVLRTRMLAKVREVYDFYDRLVESAGLRINLAWPVVVLGLALGIQFGLDADGLWSGLLLGIGISFLGMAISVALLIRGGQQFVRSQTVLATVVASNLVESPLIDAWRREWELRTRPEGVLNSETTS
jgi:hypothetical protein